MCLRFLVALQTQAKASKPKNGIEQHSGHHLVSEGVCTSVCHLIQAITQLAVTQLCSMSNLSCVCLFASALHGMNHYLNHSNYSQHLAHDDPTYCLHGSIIIE